MAGLVFCSSQRDDDLASVPSINVAVVHDRDHNFLKTKVADNQIVDLVWEELVDVASYPAAKVG
jgi:hypothetical protein